MFNDILLLPSATAWVTDTPEVITSIIVISFFLGRSLREIIYIELEVSGNLIVSHNWLTMGLIGTVNCR